MNFFDRLNSALADRYRIERHLGERMIGEWRLQNGERRSSSRPPDLQFPISNPMTLFVIVYPLGDGTLADRLRHTIWSNPSSLSSQLAARPR